MLSSHFYFRLRRLFGLAVLFAADLAWAEEVTPPVLTLPEVLARVAERNPSLAAQSHHERAAAALVEQAALRPNPTLEVGLENVLGTGRMQGVRSSETTVQASQTFERGGKRDKRVALATREREIAAQEFAVRRAEILAAAADAYVQLVAAQQRRRLAAEPLHLARQTLVATESRVNAGAASRVEAARARAAIASAQTELARAEAAVVSARAALAATWGGTAAELSEVTGALRVPEELPARDAFQARLATHPRLGLQAAIIAGRRATLTLEQAQAAPDVTAGGGVRFLREGSDAAFVAGVSLPLPLRNKNQGNIRAARETLAGAEQTTAAIDAELRAAFNTAWHELAAAHTAAQTLRREALPATEDAHTGVRRAYDTGQLPLLDVLDAQRALVAIHREILAAESDYASALARIEALADPTFDATAKLLSSP
jgi:outer membrane protein, heavy metal efflux system